MPILKEFDVSAWASWAGTCPFGGGHTADTDPTRRGWRLVAVSKTLAVVGRKGMAGCFSVMPLSGGHLDVALYDDLPPEAVDAKLRKGERVYADALKVIPSVSGWALGPLQEIENVEQGCHAP